MDKIPTLFERGPNFKVTDQVRPECQWVLDGEGIATEKLDGTNVRLTIEAGQIVRVEKRRNPTKAEKAQGAEPGYVDASDQDPSDKHIFAAVRGTNVADWPDGAHAAEAIGPKIQGNPLALEASFCVPFNLRPVYITALLKDRTWVSVRSVVLELCSNYNIVKLAEGIVFHHPDGRRAKIKRKDF